MDVAWMAWTWQTSLLFAFLALTLAVMTVLAVRRPETPHFLRVPPEPDTLTSQRKPQPMIKNSWRTLCLPWLPPQSARSSSIAHAPAGSRR